MDVILCSRSGCVVDVKARHAGRDFVHVSDLQLALSITCPMASGSFAGIGRGESPLQGYLKY